MTREAGLAQYPSVRAIDLRTRDWRGSLACSEQRPALSWRIESDRAGVRQVGYEIETARTPGFETLVARTGLIETSRPIAAPWPGEPLASREVRWCRVRLWTDAGVSPWSTPLRVEGALYAASDWAARPKPIRRARFCLEIGADQKFGSRRSDRCT